MAQQHHEAISLASKILIDYLTIVDLDESTHEIDFVEENKLKKRCNIRQTN